MFAANRNPKVSRNRDLTRVSVGKYSDPSQMYHKNGGVSPRHDANSKVEAPAKFYPAEDVKKFEDMCKPEPTKLDKFDDKYFGKVADDKNKEKKGEFEFFEAEEEEEEEKKKKEDQSVDAALIKSTSKAVPELKTYFGPRFSLKQGLLAAVLLMITTLCGVSTATPVKTIHSPDGDTFDCVNRMDQPALKHPLLKNHLIQETPSGMEKTEEEGFGWQVWHATGDMCPHGTIPLRRFDAPISHTKYDPLTTDAGDRATRGHHYAIGIVKGESFYGAKATLNVWSPVVESVHDFSLAQIWLSSGQYETNDLNTIEAGWQVFPERYGDHQPRLFTYWTRDAYLSSGCYSIHCYGFVHVSSTIALEAAIAWTSTFGGDQFAITIQIWKDPFSGNWWMGMGVNVVPVGYWPAEIFTTLFDHAINVQWGGEVLYRNISGTNYINQMGSGEYAEKEFRKAAYFCNLQIAQKNRTFLAVQELYVGATQPDSYTVKKAYSKDCGTHFYYGGPDPVRVRSGSGSGSVGGATFSLISLFLLVVLFF